MNFTGSGIRLTPSDVEYAATLLRCPIGAVKAVIAVETSGYGFGKDNRIIILFEPHKFYRFLSPTKRDEAVAAGVAYKEWGERSYPPSQASRYRQLEVAMTFSEIAALKATSWGLGQIMGFNHALADCETPQKLVERSCMSEGMQLELMCNFIINSGLDGALQALDWTTFARGYNGKSFAVNRYDKKLASAYASSLGQEERNA